MQDQASSEISNLFIMRKKFSPDKTLAYSGGIGDLLNLCQDLNQTNIRNQDKNGRTVLHYAAEYGKSNIALMMIDIILNAFFIRKTNGSESEPRCSIYDLGRLSIPKMCLRKIQLLRDTFSEALQDLLDCQDVNGDTALHLAASAGNASVVTKLIYAGANFKLKNAIGDTPLIYIYKSAPTALKAVYDSSIESVFNDVTDESSTYDIDLSSVIEFHEESDMLQPESKLLYKYISNIRNRSTNELFRHPIIQIFIDRKWRKIRVFLWISTIFHIVWLSIYSSLITHVYISSCPFTHDEIYRAYALRNNFIKSDGNSTIQSYRLWCKLKYNIYYTDLVVLMSVMSLIVLITKIFELQVSKSCKLCCFNFETFSKIFMIFLMMITLFPIFAASVDKHYNREHHWTQYVVAALGIFLAWMLMFWQFKNFPTMSLYIEIWGNVMKGFATFMATFACLLLAFAFAFQILLPSEPRHEKFCSNFMRLFVMMAGEIGFDTFFFSENVAEKLPFPDTTKILYIVFVIMVSIILFNLLVSMTVSDTQELRKSGKLRRLASQLETIYFMERFLFNRIFQCCAKRLLGRLQLTSDLEQNSKMTICLNDIPWQLHDGLKKVANPPNEMNEKSRDTVDVDPSSKYFKFVGTKNGMHSTFEIFNDNDPLLKREIYRKTSFDTSEETFTKQNKDVVSEVANL